MRFQLNNNAPLCGSLAALCVASLVGCGGGGGDDSSTSTSPVTSAANQSVNGVLLAPSSTATASRSIVQAFIGHARQHALSVACPAVPDGYDPLANVAIEFRDSAGTSQATLTTDNCGNFSGSVPSTVTTATATPQQYAAISQPIGSLTASTPTLVSTLPATASPVISVLQDLGNGNVAITVTDSVTGKAVLGLTPSAFGFTLASAALTPRSVAYGASTAQPASAAIVLDASGSMYASVGSTNLTSFELASAAAHELLDGFTPGKDEAGMVIFDNDVLTMNNSALAGSRFIWGNAAGVAAPAYTVSATGLTTTISALRPLADLYNPYSQIYLNLNGTDPVNPGTGDVRLLGYYSFGGSTAFYDATSSGIDLLAGASNSRRIVVAMTDGVDNSSAMTSNAVIAKANAAGIPLYLVAFGSAQDVDETTMSTMAQQTGGEYKRVEGDNITGLFQGIQTGIRFQYVANFPSALASNATLTTMVTYGGLTAQRDLVLH